MADSIIEQLTQSFRRFPGIGPRQAKRFVHYLLRAPRAEVDNLLRQIRELGANTAQCGNCRRFFPFDKRGASPKQNLCPLCHDPNRDSSLLMLVEKDIDLENIERSGTY